MTPTSSPAYEGWASHGLLGRIAFDSLSEAEQALFKPDMRPEALAKPYLSDRVQSAGDKVGHLCGILDMVYHDDCRPYATLPDGRWIPHSPPDANAQSSCGSGLPLCPVTATALTEMLMDRMIAAIRAGDGETAVRHGGALGHYLQEPFTPGHAMDNSLFHELFPDPDAGRHIRLHHAFDCASGQFDPLPPRLMGTTVGEAAFRLQIEIDRGIREGKKLVGPIIRSVYEGQPDAVRKALLAGQCRQAVFVTASAWHTAMALARDRFDAAEAEALDDLPLTYLVPYFLHACQYVDVLPGCLVAKGRKIPIDVWSAARQGTPAERRVADGFGMGGHSGIKYFLHGDAYTRFRCEVGLPSRHTEGQDAHTDTEFFVETDREFNTVYSEDIAYQAATQARVRLEPGQPVQPIDVGLAGARSLILRARCRPYTDPETGDVRFSIPHVAVCNPRLAKH